MPKPKAVVRTEDLIDYMSDIRLNQDQYAAVQDVIDGVTGDLERHLNRSVRQHETTETVAPDDNGVLLLKNTPVESVSLITYGAGSFWSGTVTGWQLESGIITIPPYYGTSKVTVTYVGGLKGWEHDDLRLAIMRVAAREVQNLHDDTLSAKDLNRTDTSLLPVGWQPEELKRLERYRRRVAV